MTDCIVYSIAVSSPITPSEPLPQLPDIPRGSLVIVEGWAPVVGHGPAICFMARQQWPRAAGPRLEGVVAASHSQEWQVGQVVDVTLPAEGLEERR